MNAVTDLHPLETAIWKRQGKQEGTEIRFLCPAHDDHHPSARWHPEKEVWHCDACKAGGGFKDLAQRLEVNLDGGKAKEAATLNGKSGAKPKARVIACYDYHDASGNLLYQVERLEPKSFRQRHPCGNGFTYGLGGNPERCGCEAITPVLYRLPQVQGQIAKAGAVYVVEGEKDADRLRVLGKVATCNAMGAGKWRESYAEALTGSHLTLVPDNDEVGYKHMRDVALLLAGKLESLRVLILPGLPPKGDVSDWLETHDAEDFARAVEAAPVWMASSDKPYRAFVGEVFADFVSESQAEATDEAEKEEPWEPLNDLPPKREPVPPLDPEMLPEPLRAWLTDAAERTSLPLELYAAPAVVTLAAVVGCKLGIHPKRYDDWLVVPNLWGAVVGRPGIMKSAAVGEAMRFLRQLEANAKEEHDRLALETEVKREVLEAEIAVIKKQLRGSGKRGKDE